MWFALFVVVTSLEIEYLLSLNGWKLKKKGRVIMAGLDCFVSQALLDEGLTGFGYSEGQYCLLS